MLQCAAGNFIDAGRRLNELEGRFAFVRPERRDDVMEPNELHPFDGAFGHLRGLCRYLSLPVTSLVVAEIDDLVDRAKHIGLETITWGQLFDLVKYCINQQLTHVALDDLNLNP